jgi:hypothetical protein
MDDRFSIIHRTFISQNLFSEESYDKNTLPSTNHTEVIVELTVQSITEISEISRF